MALCEPCRAAIGQRRYTKASVGYVDWLTRPRNVRFPPIPVVTALEPNLPLHLAESGAVSFSDGVKRVAYAFMMVTGLLVIGLLTSGLKGYFDARSDAVVLGPRADRFLAQNRGSADLEEGAFKRCF